MAPRAGTLHEGPERRGGDDRRSGEIVGQRSKTSHHRNTTDLSIQRLCASFVDRYIPGYVFFGDTVENGYVDEHGQAVPPPWRGNALRIVIGGEREVISTAPF